MAVTGKTVDEDLRRYIRKAAGLSEEMRIVGDLAVMKSSSAEETGVPHVKVYNDWEEDIVYDKTGDEPINEGEVGQDGDGGIVAYTGVYIRGQSILCQGVISFHAIFWHRHGIDARSIPSRPEIKSKSTWN